MEDIVRSCSSTKDDLGGLSEFDCTGVIMTSSTVGGNGNDREVNDEDMDVEGYHWEREELEALAEVEGRDRMEDAALRLDVSNER